MKITVDVSRLKTKEAQAEIMDAARKGMRDTVSEIHRDAVQNSPVLTGNNRRSLASESSGFDTGEGLIDQSKLEGAVYSTSGYGGFLETGTRRSGARPYIGPAAQKHVPKFPDRMKEHMP
jgi:hypothetical protein